MIAVLLPVKIFAQSKQRLAAVLGPEAREQLARAMFDDTWETLLALREQGDVGQLLVTTAEPYVLDRCAHQRIPCLPEHGQISHSKSVEKATAWTTEQGVTTLLSVPIDTPGVSTSELTSLLGQAASYDVVIVPSADGTGTNALLRTPPHAIRPQFGPGSLHLHVQSAEAEGFRYTIHSSPGLGADIDTLEDVQRFLALDRLCRTTILLRKFFPENDKGAAPVLLATAEAARAVGKHDGVPPCR